MLMVARRNAGLEISGRRGRRRSRLFLSAQPAADGGSRHGHHPDADEVVADGDTHCRFIWTTDILPDALAPYIDGQMTEGAKAIKAAMERQRVTGD